MASATCDACVVTKVKRVLDQPRRTTKGTLLSEFLHHMTNWEHLALRPAVKPHQYRQLLASVLEKHKADGCLSMNDHTCSLIWEGAE